MPIGTAKRRLEFRETKWIGITVVEYHGVKLELDSTTGQGKESSCPRRHGPKGLIEEQ